MQIYVFEVDAFKNAYMVPFRNPVKYCIYITTYGIVSVNVSVNGLSHMPRSSTETVYGIVSERTKKQTFYN